MVPATAKLAAAVFVLSINTVQLGVLPAHTPDQPLKVDPVFAAAVSVTVDPPMKPAVQVVPQLMPDGLDVTTPLPEPTLLTVNDALGTTAGSNRAVAVLLASIVTVQLNALPVHPPDQPPKVDPVATLALNVTVLFAAKLAVQVRPQSMPAGFDATLPEPVPTWVTVRAALTTAELKVAVTVCAALIVTVQLNVVPVQLPDQPAKLAPLLTTAFKVTAVPVAKLAEQVVPQLMPVGVEVTVPALLPVPALVTVNVLLVVTTTFGLPI